VEHSRHIAMFDLSSAIHKTGHYHVRPRPVGLLPSCVRSANNGQNRHSSCALASLDLRRHVQKIGSGLKRRIGDVWRRRRIPKWRATVDEDGQYCFAVALWNLSLHRAPVAETATTRACVLRLDANAQYRGSPRNRIQRSVTVRFAQGAPWWPEYPNKQPHLAPTGIFSYGPKAAAAVSDYAASR